MIAGNPRGTCHTVRLRLAVSIRHRGANLCQSRCHFESGQRARTGETSDQLGNRPHGQQTDLSKCSAREPWYVGVRISQLLQQLWNGCGRRPPEVAQEVNGKRPTEDVLHTQPSLQCQHVTRAWRTDRAQTPGEVGARPMGQPIDEWNDRRRSNLDQRRSPVVELPLKAAGMLYQTVIAVHSRQSKNLDQSRNRSKGTHIPKLERSLRPLRRVLRVKVPEIPLLSHRLLQESRQHPRCGQRDHDTLIPRHSALRNGS